MIVANPIYDAVFKYLMEDTEVARKLLSAIIGEDIVEIEVQPQEQTAFSERFSILLYRLDFKAIIKSKTGEHKKILIELQKAKDPIDIIRFRRYLGENYQKEDQIRNEQGVLDKKALPIITVYILGFQLQKVKTAALKVNRVYKDIITNEELDVTEEFIEQLTHDSFVIQIPRLQTKMKNRIERILGVFNQSYATDTLKLLDLPIEIAEDEVSNQIAKRLAKAAESETVRKQMQVEEEFEDAIERSLREKDRQAEAALNAALNEVIERMSREKDEEIQQAVQRVLQEKEREIEELKQKLNEK